MRLSPHCRWSRAILGLMGATALVGCGARDDGTARAPETTATAMAESAPETTDTPAATETPIDEVEPTPAPRATMEFSARPLSEAVRNRVVGSSWKEGCPVPIADLRYLRIPYLGFDGELHLGELIVHEDAVEAMRTAFASLQSNGLPIRRMRLIDDYGASDFESIERDNTSAFNCRPVTGGSGWSEHAYGRAVDVNPIENPYVYPNGSTVHPASERFLDRSEVLPGMAVEGGAYVADFASAGWRWGGDWSPAQDLQHFSATGK